MRPVNDQIPEISASAGIGRGRHLAAIVALLLFIPHAFGARAAEIASALQSSINGRSMPQTYNIQAGSLPTALDDFSAASGVQVLYDGTLASGRVSSPVRGQMNADTALGELLQGTGLAAVFTRDGNVIIVLSPDAVKVLYTPPPATSARELGAIHVDVPKIALTGGVYATLVQYELQRVLRSKPDLLVGRYQAQVRIWVDASGVVQRSQLVASNANTRCQEGLIELLKHMSVGQPPPPDLPQPVSIHVAVSGR